MPCEFINGWVSFLVTMRPWNMPTTNAVLSCASPRGFCCFLLMSCKMRKVFPIQGLCRGHYMMIVRFLQVNILWIVRLWSSSWIFFSCIGSCLSGKLLLYDYYYLSIDYESFILLVFESVLIDLPCGPLDKVYAENAACNQLLAVIGFLRHRMSLMSQIHLKFLILILPRILILIYILMLIYNNARSVYIYI